MARLSVVAAVLAGQVVFAQAVGDEFTKWKAPVATQPDEKGVVAVCEALDQAVRTADVEAGAEFMDFPVLLVNDDAAATPSSATLDRAHWIGSIEGAIQAVVRFNLRLDSQREVRFVSDSLALVLVDHEASMGTTSKRWKSTYLMVRRNDTWKVKGLAGRGWGALPVLDSAHAPRKRLPAAVELFNKRCATCHGHDGKGDTIVGAELKVSDLTLPEVQARFTDAQLLKRILEGSVDKETGKGRMTAYRGKYPEAELEALIPVVRAFARKDAPRR